MIFHKVHFFFDATYNLPELLWQILQNYRYALVLVESKQNQILINVRYFWFLLQTVHFGILKQDPTFSSCENFS